MNDLVTWLREQIAETERDVRESPEWPQWNIAPSRMAARINGVLAQCEAHTAIVDGYAALWANTDRHTDAALHLHYNVLKQVVRALALAYQHRPGYREEWRP